MRHLRKILKGALKMDIQVKYFLYGYVLAHVFNILQDLYLRWFVPYEKRWDLRLSQKPYKTLIELIKDRKN
jgi:hypothetical protein